MSEESLTHPSPLSGRWKGVFFGAVAAATYGMNPLFTLPLYQEGMNADSVLFYRYSLAALILGGLMHWRRQSFALTLRDFFGVLTVGLLFAVSSLTLFLSYRKMDAGIASTLLFVYPLMVAIIMALFFREKITRVTLFSILLALFGIALLYRGPDGAVLSTVGIVLVMLSALSYAVYIVGVNRSGLKEMTGVKLTFYALLSGLIVYIVRLKFCLELQWIPSWNACGNLIALAILPTVVSLVCTALAIHHLGATPTAILGALEPVTAVFFGVMMFGEKLSVRLIAGIALILISVTLIIGGKSLIRKFVRNGNID